MELSPRVCLHLWMMVIVDMKYLLSRDLKCSETKTLSNAQTWQIEEHFEFLDYGCSVQSMKYSEIWEAKQQTPKLPDQKPFWHQAFWVRNAYLAISVGSFLIININYGPRVKSLNNSTITQLSNDL